ncbi:MAG: leucine-rich repeat protein [Kiritimatiellia bacterium]
MSILSEVGRGFGTSFRRAGLAGALLAAAQVVADDEVTKTWALELPEESGITNNAPVMITDGNYRLKCWIVSAETKRLGIGAPSVKDDDDAAGLALEKDADGAYVGSGDLDLRGAITVDGAASGWTITTIGRYAFSAVVAAPFDVCTLPVTLLSMSENTFQSCGSKSGFSTFRLHAPDMTGDLPNNTFLVSRAPTRLDLKIPKVTCLGGYWKRGGYVDFLKDTDVSDWDLSSVRLISTAGHMGKTSPGWLLRWSKFRGTMRLPSLKWLTPRTFESCPNLNALEIGRNGTLEYVGYHAVSNAPALGSVVIGGAVGGFTVSTNGFYGAGLTNVTFLTTAPVYEEPDSIIFGTEETPALQIAFHIPLPGARSWDATWRRFALAARPATDAERADFERRFGAYAVQGLVGIVPPAVFRTAREQWLVCGHSPLLRHTVDVSVMDPRFTADSVAVSPAPDADGRYAAGTRITVTSRFDADSAQFRKWRGTVSDEDAPQNPLTLTVDRDLTLAAHVHHDWTFAPDDPDAAFATGMCGTVSNAVWTLGVVVLNASHGLIAYGTGSDGSAWRDRGEGLLDLNGRVRWPQAEGSVQTLTVAGYSGLSFKINSKYLPQERFPRMIVLPEDLGVSFSQAFRCEAGLSLSPTNLVVEDSRLTGDLMVDMIGSYVLTGGRFVLPKVTSIFSNYAFAMGDTVDVSDWRFDAVTNVVGEKAGTWGVFRGIFANTKYCGTLHLPMLADVQTNAFRAAVNLDACELGLNTVVRKIGDKAFNGCTSLARLRLRAGRTLSVGEEAFTDTAKLKFIEFTYEATADPTAVDRILAGTTAAVADSAEPPVIHASRAMGWRRDRIPNIQTPTAEELAARPPYVPSDGRLLGVWQTADGVRKAWVVHQASADDPKGSIVILR